MGVLRKIVLFASFIMIFYLTGFFTVFAAESDDVIANIIMTFVDGGRLEKYEYSADTGTVVQVDSMQIEIKYEIKTAIDYVKFKLKVTDDEGKTVSGGNISNANTSDPLKNYMQIAGTEITMQKINNETIAPGKYEHRFALDGITVAEGGSYHVVIESVERQKPGTALFPTVTGDIIFTASGNLTIEIHRLTNNPIYNTNTDKMDLQLPAKDFSFHYHIAIDAKNQEELIAKVEELNNDPALVGLKTVGGSPGWAKDIDLRLEVIALEDWISLGDGHIANAYIKLFFDDKTGSTKNLEQGSNKKIEYVMNILSTLEVIPELSGLYYNGGLVAGADPSNTELGSPNVESFSPDAGLTSITVEVSFISPVQPPQILPSEAPISGGNVYPRGSVMVKFGFEMASECDQMELSLSGSESSMFFKLYSVYYNGAKLNSADYIKTVNYGGRVVITPLMGERFQAGSYTLTILTNVGSDLSSPGQIGTVEARLTVSVIKSAIGEEEELVSESVSYDPFDLIVAEPKNVI